LGRGGSLAVFPKFPCKLIGYSIILNEFCNLELRAFGRSAEAKSERVVRNEITGNHRNTPEI